MFEWLGTVSRVRFLREFYLHKPHSVAQGASGIVSLLSWDILRRVLPQCEASHVLAVKDGRLWRGPDPQTDVEAFDLFKAGYSLVVRHAERHDADLAKLAAEFAFDFRTRKTISGRVIVGGRDGSYSSSRRETDGA